MPNMTVQTDRSVTDYITAVDHPTRRADAEMLDQIFRDITGWTPRMWGPSIIGYGAYHYKYDSGHEGDSLATGFSPRKAHQVLYIMPGYQNYGHLLDRLGKHRCGKSCLYVNKLADIDLIVLRDLIATGLADLGEIWPVRPS